MSDIVKTIRSSATPIRKLVEKVDSTNTKLEQLTDEANGSHQERVKAPLDMEKLRQEEEKGSFDEWYVNYRCKEMLDEKGKPLKPTQRVASYVKENPERPMTCKVLLVSVLAGSSNAQPERFFSRVTCITTKRRSSMKKKPVEDTVTCQELMKTLPEAEDE